MQKPMGIKRVGNKKGTTAVEFAMVLSLFVLLILGIVDFGFYFFIQHTLQFATREGTRLALTGQQLTDSKGNFISREASIVNTIKGYASVAVDPEQLNINIFRVGSDYSDPNDWNKQVNAGSPGAYMRVRTTYTYAFLTPVIGAFFPRGNILVQAESTYRNELFST
jgi:Flp pilus assembly protein TadG